MPTNPDRDRDPVSDPDLVTIREAFDYDTNEWQNIRREGSKDMRYVAGDPWDQLERQAREDAKRPVLALDELGQYVNQLINDVRQHQRAIKVTPQGNGATDQTAQFRANLYRQIEYRSNAQMAYTTMFENTVQRSYGFFRIKPRYVSDRSDEQELIIDPIMNPDLVTIDADILQPDGSDMRHAFVHEAWRQRDFKKRFPEAKVVDFTGQIQAAAPSWVKDETIMLAEYWDLVPKKRTLLFVAGPQGKPIGIFEDELETPKYAALKQSPLVLGPGGGPKTREVETHHVRMQLTNGVEILEETDFGATMIPIVCCFGKIMYVDDGSGPKRKILSLVRLARDPYMLYCYYRTTEAELVGMTPKTPFVGYEGQFRGHEADWQKVAHEPVAYLEAKAMTEATGGQILPLPQRQPYDPPIQPLEIGAEAARRAIQSAMGISPLPTQAQRRNDKSGKALQVMRDAEQQGSYHFVDHYEQAITRGGAILEDWTPHYYDAARDVTVRQPNNDTETIRINDPDHGSWPKGQKDVMPIGDEVHDVTLSVGPSTMSERDAENDLADNLAGNLQPIAGIIGPQSAAKLLALSIRLKNTGPIATEMAEIIAPKDQEGQQLAQLQQQGQQLQAMVKELSAHVQQLSQEKEAKIIESQSKERIEAMDNASRERIAMINTSAQVGIAGAKIDAENARTYIDALEQRWGKALELHLESVHKAVDRIHEAHSQRQSQAHDAGMAAMEHGHAILQAQHASDIAPVAETSDVAQNSEPTT